MVLPLNLNTTYEELMQYKLDNTSNELDKREITSLLFNAFANNSLETVQMLFTIMNSQDLVFADTAPREFLIRRAAERGLRPRPATLAIRKGTFNIELDLGVRFSIENVNYVVTKRIMPSSLFEYELTCETPGIIGNSYFGNLLPIDYIQGLETSVLSDIIIPGENEEDTEDFRRRYFLSFETSAFGGNRADYKEKVNAIPGVGGVKVYRAWNGGGTVKLVIIDSQFKVPSQALVQEVQRVIDPIGMQGEGVGLAPIDHVVTVFPVAPKTVDINFQITYDNGYSWDDVRENVFASVDSYFTSLGKEWGESVTYEDDMRVLIVRISQLETRLLSINGILDVGNTTINGLPENLQVNVDNIPVRGVVSG